MKNPNGCGQKATSTGLPCTQPGCDGTQHSGSKRRPKNDRATSAATRQATRHALAETSGGLTAVGARAAARNARWAVAGPGHNRDALGAVLTEYGKGPARDIRWRPQWKDCWRFVGQMKWMLENRTEHAWRELVADCDQFIEAEVVGADDVSRWCEPAGLGDPEIREMVHGQTTRRQRRQVMRSAVRDWPNDSSTAQQIRHAGEASHPESQLELDECVDAALTLEEAGGRFDTADIADLVSRRRRALGHRHSAPSALALDAAAWGQYARERVQQLCGTSNPTSQAAAALISQRCRQSYLHERMAIPGRPNRAMRRSPERDAQDAFLDAASLR